MKLLKQFLCSALSLALLGLGACGGSRAQSQEQTESETSPEHKAAPFSADSAYSYVVAQVQMGPRTPGSEAHTRCARWIEEKLQSCSASRVRTTTARPLRGPTSSPPYSPRLKIASC